MPHSQVVRPHQTRQRRHRRRLIIHVQHVHAPFMTQAHVAVVTMNCGRVSHEFRRIAVWRPSVQPQSLRTGAGRKRRKMAAEPLRGQLRRWLPASRLVTREQHRQSFDARSWEAGLGTAEGGRRQRGAGNSEMKTQAQPRQPSLRLTPPLRLPSRARSPSVASAG